MDNFIYFVSYISTLVLCACSISEAAKDIDKKKYRMFGMDVAFALSFAVLFVANLLKLIIR